MILPGIYASQISGHLAPYSDSDFVSITTAIVDNSGASSITFSSIPSTYTHLQVRGIGRTDNSGTDVSSVVVQFNSDTGSNYTRHSLYGSGSTVGTGVATSQTSTWGGTLLTATHTNMFGASIIDVLDYTNTSKNKVVRILSGGDYNGGGYLQFFSGAWLNTSAISSITLFDNSGSNFAQYSTFALYGVK